MVGPSNSRFHFGRQAIRRGGAYFDLSTAFRVWGVAP